jgi:hypothetical protein
MERHPLIFNSDILKQLRRLIAKGYLLERQQKRTLMDYLKQPFVCSKLRDAGWDLAILDEVRIVKPFSLELALESLSPRLKSLPQITGDDASNKVQVSSSSPGQFSIGDEDLNSSLRSRSRFQDCFVLDVEQLVDYGLLHPDGPERGILCLFNVYSGLPLSIVWEIERSSPHSAWLTLYLDVPRERILTSRTQIWRRSFSSDPIFANWWLRCPHVGEGSCKTFRTKKLYLQPGSSIFRCSRCLNLGFDRSKDMRHIPMSLSMVFARQS